MAFRILVTEGVSPIGSALLRGFEDHVFSIICPEPGVVDWCDQDSVLALVRKARPSVVINTLNWLATVEGVNHAPPCLPGALAELSKTNDLTVIHLSSHEVFSDLHQEGQLLESHEPDPSSDLGNMLLAAEEAYQAVPRCLILRLPWIVDAPNGLLDKVCSALTSGDVMVSDIWRGTPVSSDRVVSAIIAVVQQILCGAENWKVMHFHASDSCSEAEFADFISRTLTKFGCKVGVVSIVPQSDRLMTSNSWLGGKRLTNGFGIQLRSWRVGTKALVRRWLEPKVASGEVLVAPAQPDGAADDATEEEQKLC